MILFYAAILSLFGVLYKVAASRASVNERKMINLEQQCSQINPTGGPGTVFRLGMLEMWRDSYLSKAVGWAGVANRMYKVVSWIRLHVGRTASYAGGKLDAVLMLMVSEVMGWTNFANIAHTLKGMLGIC